MRRALAVGLVMVLGGCAYQARQLDSEPFTTSRERPPRVLIEVDNLNFADARLYAVRDGQRISLGTVTGKQSDRFTVDWNFTQPLRIEINLLAGPTCMTETLYVEPGDILELQIASIFSQSAFCR